jgi:hypothetical protein
LIVSLVAEGISQDGRFRQVDCSGRYIGQADPYI